MNCKHCEKRAIWKEPELCSEHFIEHFEKKVTDTIKEHDLIDAEKTVLVAASGGKDSLATLHLLNKLGYTVDALAIDEGIAGYRSDTLIELESFCKKRSIPLKTVPFTSVVGKELDTIMKGKNTSACTTCGTLRRHLMNKHAQGYEVIATGHNADDEAQAVLMNILRAQTQMLTRAGPKTGSQQGLTERIKPLYFCTEKEILTYALLEGFAGEWTECPYAHASYRAKVRDALNEYALKHPKTKQNILKKYLTIRKQVPVESTPQFCAVCGSPSTGESCAACKLISFHTSKQHVQNNTSITNNT